MVAVTCIQIVIFHDQIKIISFLIPARPSPRSPRSPPPPAPRPRSRPRPPCSGPARATPSPTPRPASPRRTTSPPSSTGRQAGRIFAEKYLTALLQAAEAAADDGVPQHLAHLHHPAHGCPAPAPRPGSLPRPGGHALLSNKGQGRRLVLNVIILLPSYMYFLVSFVNSSCMQRTYRRGTKHAYYCMSLYTC